MEVNKFKGISPVIATILMVMITVGLVALSYSFFSEIINVGGEKAVNATKHFGAKDQQLEIKSIWNDSEDIGVTIMSSGSSPVTLEYVTTYVDDAIKQWAKGSIKGCDKNETLSVGDSCSLIIEETYDVELEVKVVDPSGNEVKRTTT